MKIKITSCSSEKLWYRNHIGEIFTVKTRNEESIKGGYYDIKSSENKRILNKNTLNLKGFLGFIVHVDDCVIVKL